MKVEIEESKLQTAYANACDGVKDFMESLFGKKVFEAAKPTLDDYKTIRTYEDACKALGEPIFEDPNNLPNHIIALMKLETISLPRLRMRTLGSACAKKRKKRQSISGSNSLNFGLNI